MLETRLVHRSYLHEPRVRLVEAAPSSLRRGVRADPPRRLARPAARCRGGAARRPRAHPPRRPRAVVRPGRRPRGSSAPSALARVGPAGAVPTTTARPCSTQSFGVKTYRRDLGRLGAGRRPRGRALRPRRPPRRWTPTKSENRLLKALRKARAIERRSRRGPVEEAIAPTTGAANGSAERAGHVDHADQGKRRTLRPPPLTLRR